MSIQQTEFTKFIKLLHDNECLKYMVLVGSWAEYIYKETNMIKNFEPNIKTLDMDFLLINMRKPNPPKNLIDLARKENYIIQTDRLNGTTKILDKKGLEIEFLINKIGAGYEPTVKTNLGVVAQSLRHMDILLRNKVEIEYYNMKVLVPLPEAYVIHKIVINNQRKEKQEKDKLAICNLWPHLNENVFSEIVSSLTKKEQKAIKCFTDENVMPRSDNG